MNSSESLKAVAQTSVNPVLRAYSNYSLKVCFHTRHSLVCLQLVVSLVQGFSFVLLIALCSSHGRPILVWHSGEPRQCRCLSTSTSSSSVHGLHSKMDSKRHQKDLQLPKARFSYRFAHKKHRNLEFRSWVSLRWGNSAVETHPFPLHFRGWRSWN